jgi:hypothetical protein
MKLIPNWKQAWKFYSVWGLLLIGLFAFLQAEVLPLLQEQLSPTAYARVNLLLVIVGGIGRLIYQHSANTTSPPEPDQ